MTGEGPLTGQAGSSSPPPPPPDNVMTTTERQRLLLSLCLKQETSTTVEKVRQLISEQLVSDAAFVLCTAEEDGCTPLHYAAKYGNAKIAQYLVNHTSVRLTCRDHSDRLAVHYAIEGGFVELALFLIPKYPPALMTHGLFGPTQECLLHLATKVDRSRDATLVKCFVRMGADPLLRDLNGMTPYDIAQKSAFCSAFFLNHYLLNRTVHEQQWVAKPEDIDDDDVAVRAEKRSSQFESADGYTPSQRRLVKCNRQWWDEGVEAVQELASFCY